MLESTQHLEQAFQEALLQVEAVIFASESPVTVARLKQALGGDWTSAQIRQMLQQLSILQHGRSIELVETAQGFKFQVKARYRQAIHQAYPERPIKLSPSLLEILSVIAYHQPVTRGDIEHIRGVSTNSQILKTLFEWNWIKESGFRDIPGRPALLITTSQFLHAFGMDSLSDLPAMPQDKDIVQIDAHQLRS